MRTLITTVLVIGGLISLSAYGQVRGDSIMPIVCTNGSSAAQASVVTTNANSSSPTNFVDGALISFNDLSGFSFPLNDEIYFNTNRPAWADGRINADRKSTRLNSSHRT